MNNLNTKINKLLILFITIVICVNIVFLYTHNDKFNISYGSSILGDTKDVLSTSKAGDNVTHTISFLPTDTNIKHIKVEFHITGGPLSPISDIEPTDLTTANFNFPSSSLWSDPNGISSNISSSFTSNSLVLTRTDAGPYVLPNTLRTIRIDTTTNPNTTGNIFFTISTYANDVDLANGIAASKEYSRGAIHITNGFSVRGYKGKTFIMSVDDDDVSSASNSSDNVSNPDIAVRNKINFGTLKEGFLPLADPNTGYGTDGHKITINTNANEGYWIKLEDDPTGLASPGAILAERSSIDFDNGVINDFGEENLSGAVAGKTQVDYQTAVGNNDETFTFKIISGNAPSLALNRYYSLKTSSATAAEIAKYANYTFIDHQYIIKFFATKNQDTPTSSYSDTLTYTVTPAL